MYGAIDREDLRELSRVAESSSMGDHESGEDVRRLSRERSRGLLQWDNGKDKGKHKHKHKEEKHLLKI